MDFLNIHSQNQVDEVHGYGSKIPIFEMKIFSKALRKFSTRRMIMFNILGRLSKVISLRSKKDQSHTTHQSEDIDENPAHIEENRFRMTSLCTTVVKYIENESELEYITQPNIFIREFHTKRFCLKRHLAFILH